MASGLRELVASGLYRHRGVSVAVTKSPLSLSSLLLPSPHPTVIALGTHTFSLLTEVAFSGFSLTMPLQPLAFQANGYFFGAFNQSNFHCSAFPRPFTVLTSAL